MAHYGTKESWREKLAEEVNRQSGGATGADAGDISKDCRTVTRKEAERIANGRGPDPSVDQLYEVADHLGCTIHDLLPATD